jgi:hypothetical protein
MDELAPMLVAIFFIVTTGGVILLRPISKKLGTYLEVLAEERRRALDQKAPVERVDTAPHSSASKTGSHKSSATRTSRKNSSPKNSRPICTRAD